MNVHPITEPKLGERAAWALLRDVTDPEIPVLTLEDFREADEVFSTGNVNKVVPVARLDDRSYGPGPVSAEARALYWDFAHA